MAKTCCVIAEIFSEKAAMTKNVTEMNSKLVEKNSQLVNMSSERLEMLKDKTLIVSWILAVLFVITSEVKAFL